MAASLQQFQEELVKTLKSVSELSTELNDVNKRVSFLNNDRLEKGNIIEELKVDNRQFANMMNSGGGGDLMGKMIREKPEGIDGCRVKMGELLEEARAPLVLLHRAEMGAVVADASASHDIEPLVLRLLRRPA